MNSLIIVPTFHTARRSKDTAVTATYDHETMLHQEGLLPRLLDSLQNVHGVTDIAVLVSGDMKVNQQASEKVQKIASRYPDVNIMVIGAPEASLVQQRIEQLGGGRMAKEVGLTGYGALRNLGMVIAHALGFESVLFLDDDVVIDDPDFMHKAVYGLGKLTRKGIPILAKSGFYFNADDSYLASTKSQWYDKYWDQNEMFNAWISKAMRSARLSRSNHVCGGCLILHREALSRVAFDPWIARGEDTDYLLNLRMYGADAWFDNKWYLKHLPAEGGLSEGQRFRQDVYRWVYEYRKMEFSRTQIDLLQVKPASLQPYPGPFLEPGVLKRIRKTAFRRSLGTSDKAAYRQARKAAKGEADAYAQANCSKYFELQFVWPELMARMQNDQIITNALMKSAEIRQQVVSGEAEERYYADQSPEARVEREAAARQAAEAMQARERRLQERRAGSRLDPGVTAEINLNIVD